MACISQAAVLVFLGAVLLALTACRPAPATPTATASTPPTHLTSAPTATASAPPNQPVSPPTPSPQLAPATPTGTASVLSTRPTSTPIAFPQLAPVPGNPPNMAALLAGTLVVENGCLRVATMGGSSFLVVWPPEAILIADGAAIRVTDANGREVARVGQPVQLGGGSLSLEAITTNPRYPLREAPSPACPGPYWLIIRFDGSGPARSTTPSRP